MVSPDIEENNSFMPLINPGRKAPAFNLPDQHGGSHALKDYAGKPVVLYFYPKDDTSGCTKEACAFRDLLPKFTKSKAVVLGVSPDDSKSHARFAEKFNLPFTLLADEADDDGAPAVCQAYGVWQEKSMYGRKYMGVSRTTYLIDADGKVARRWDKVKVDGHAEEVLDAADSM
jgi:peroxiredoxin Q/BCP